MKHLALAAGITLVLMAASCGGGGEEEIPSLSGCSPKEARAAVDVMTPLIEEFSDHFDRAGSTSRIALSPVIGDMQRTLRDLRSQEVPSCATAIQADLGEAWDTAIDAALAFQSDEPDSTVEKMFEEATALMKQANDDLVNLNVDALAAD
jgi:hypothetical protein